MPISFARDIKPLFKQIDIDHMNKHDILLDDYTYMSDPSNDHGNAQAVEASLTNQSMPPGDRWNPNAPEFMDVLKQHHAFVKQMIDQGKIAIAGPFPLSDQGELRGVAIFRVGTEQTAQLTQDDPTVKSGMLKPEIHPWGTGKGALASGQPMP